MLVGRSSTTSSVGGWSTLALLRRLLAVAAYLVRKRCDVERLCEVSVEAGGEKALSVPGHRVGGQCDDDRVGGRGLGTQKLQRRHTVHIGELDVEQDQPRSLRPRHA